MVLEQPMLKTQISFIIYMNPFQYTMLATQISFIKPMLKTQISTFGSMDLVSIAITTQQLVTPAIQPVLAVICCFP